MIRENTQLPASEKRPRRSVRSYLTSYLGEDIVGGIRAKVTQQGYTYTRLAMEAGINIQPLAAFLIQLGLPTDAYRLTEPTFTTSTDTGSKREEALQDPLLPYEVNRTNKTRYFREFDMLGLPLNTERGLYNNGFGSLRTLDETPDELLLRLKGIDGKQLDLIRERIGKFRAYLKGKNHGWVVPRSDEHPILVEPIDVAYAISHDKKSG